MTLDWLHIVALLGALQGFFLAAILATQRRNRTANRLLAVAMLAFSIYLVSAVYYGGGLVERYPHFFGASYPMPLIFGPVIYLYAVAASDSTRRLRRRDYLHFAPFVVVVIASLPIYLMSGAEKIAFFHGLQQGLRTPLLDLVDPLKFVSGISYATATIVFLQRHRSRVKENYSSIERVNLRWLLHLAGAAAAIWALATVLEVMEVMHRILPVRERDPVALALAILVYWIGYQALRQPEIFNFAAIDARGPHLELLRSAAPAPPPPSVAGGGSASAAARYERSGLTDREAAALKNALLAVMEKEKLYQRSELTLADLAERLDTTPHKLSEVLNSELGQTFYDFVNAYRVQDVQRRIADERSKHLKILSLAMDAGFASKSTFNHVFRQHTGRTPSDYRRSLSA